MPLCVLYAVVHVLKQHILDEDEATRGSCSNLKVSRKALLQSTKEARQVPAPVDWTQPVSDLHAHDTLTLTPKDRQTHSARSSSHMKRHEDTMWWVGWVCVGREGGGGPRQWWHEEKPLAVLCFAA